jgi:hypothetical protein
VLEHTTRVKTHKFQTSIINLNWKIQEERWWSKWGSRGRESCRFQIPIDPFAGSELS